jgi:hypothetical protein
MPEVDRPRGSAKSNCDDPDGSFSNEQLPGESRASNLISLKNSGAVRKSVADSDGFLVTKTPSLSTHN